MEESRRPMSLMGQEELRSKVRNRGVVTNGTHFLTVVLTRVHIKHTMAHNSTVVPLFPYYEPWNV